MDRKKLGFTLVELLVAFAIIAVLAGIIVGSLSYARKYAKSARCLGNLNAIAKSMRHYAEDHNGSSPNEFSPVPWEDQMIEYLPDKNVYWCPADLRPIDVEYPISYTWRNAKVMVNPRAAISRVNLLSASPDHLALVWEIPIGLHGDPDYLNYAAINTSTRSYTAIEHLMVDLPTSLD